MKLLSINSVPYGSTGKIMFALSDIAKRNGFDTLCTCGYTFVKSNRSDCFITSNIVQKFLHKELSYLTGKEGCYSYFATKRLIKKIDNFNPDIIHLHNLHGWFVNLPLLFNYIKKKNIKVIWTLHDCWSFTGHCPHFDMVGCDKWQDECFDCKQYKNYPSSLRDNSKAMYNFKKETFCGVADLTIVTPSAWLGGLVKKSFLNEYPVKVINNGIDLSVFKPTESDFRKKYNLENKFIILGVAFGWGERKGLDVFIELSKILTDEYKIVLVGTDEKVDKLLNDNILSIHRTQNQTELAEIYTCADLFVNPTREDNFPTVNLEALACGTPVLTFRTGGSPESLDEKCGSVVDKNDFAALLAEIYRIKEEPFDSSNCIDTAKQYDKDDKFAEYIKLYEEK